MSEYHFHDFKGPPRPYESERKLYKNLILIAAGTFVPQAIVSLVGVSVAVLSDTLHTLMHGLGFFVAWKAVVSVSQLQVDSDHETEKKKIYFRHACAIGLFVILPGIIFISYEAIQKLFNPLPVVSDLMFLGGLLGTIGNTVAYIFLIRNREKNVVKSIVWWDLLSDIGQSILIMIVAPLIGKFHLYSLDSYLSLLIAATMGIRVTYGLIKKS